MLGIKKYIKFPVGLARRSLFPLDLLYILKFLNASKCMVFMIKKAY